MESNIEWHKTSEELPAEGEIVLLANFYKNVNTGNKADITFKVTKEEGEAIANTLLPCVYYDAIQIHPAEKITIK
jgi:hypothetical protein